MSLQDRAEAIRVFQATSKNSPSVMLLSLRVIIMTTLPCTVIIIPRPEVWD